VTPVSVLLDLDQPEWWERLGPGALSDLQSAVTGLSQDEPPNFFLDAIVRSASSAASDLQREAWFNERHDADDPGSGTERSAGAELLDRTHLVAAAPSASDSTTDGTPPAGAYLDAVRCSPQTSMIVDQLVSRRLLGQASPEVEELLQSMFLGVCREHGLDAEEAAALFKSMTRWVDITVCGISTKRQGIRSTWSRSVIYDESALRQQRDWLISHAVRPSSVMPFLDNLRQHIHAAHSKIALTMLGQNKSLSISDLYVTPSIVLDRWPSILRQENAADRSESRQLTSDDSGVPPMPRPYASEGRETSSVRLGSRIPLSELAGRRTVVLGNPGIGKSTLATKLAFDGSSAEARGVPLPFVVTLRDVIAERSKTSISIVEYIGQSARNDLQAAEASTDFIHHLLHGGYLHIVFDGLDEVTDPENYRWTLQAIEGFCLEYKAARVTVTSRVHGFDRGLFPDFEIYLLSPFDVRQTRSYVERWFALDETLSPTRRNVYVNDFMEQSAAAADLRSIPLMLALMCSIFFIQGDIPSSRSEIYQKCAELYFRDWDARRKIRASEVISHLPPSVIFEAFSALAAAILNQPVLVGSGISESELRRLLREFFIRKEILQPGEERTVADEFSRFVTGRAWLVDKVGRDSGNAVLYQFTHRTFLEYFAAEHYVRTMTSPIDLAEFVLGALGQDGPVVVAELAVQICARDRPGDVDTVLLWAVDVASRARLADRQAAVRFLVSLVGDVALARSTVSALVALSIDTLVAMGEMALSIWRWNGYPDQVSVSWFEFRSLGQASGLSVDEAGELLGEMVRSRTTSRAMLAETVRTAIERALHRRPRAAAYLAAALHQVLGEGVGGPAIPWDGESVAFWRSVARHALLTEQERVTQESAADPSLACQVCLAAISVISVRQVTDWHGLAVLFRLPLNPFCDSGTALGSALLNVIAQPSIKSDRPNSATRLALRDIWRQAVAGFDLPADITPWPGDLAGINRGALEDSQGNPAVTAEDLAAAVFLIMVQQVLEFRTSLPRALGPHLEVFRAYLETWRSAAEEELRESLRQLLPPEFAAVLLGYATRLRSVDLTDQYRPVPPRSKYGPSLEGFSRHLDAAARFTPVGLSQPEQVARAQERVSLLRRLAEVRDQYRAPLAVALGELAEMPGVAGLALHEERLALIRREDSDEADETGELAEAHRDLAAALLTCQRPAEALRALHESLDAFIKVPYDGIWSYTGGELDYVVDVSGLVVTMQRRLDRRAGGSLAARWIAILDSLIDEEHPALATSGLAAMARRCEAERLPRLGRRVAAALDTAAVSRPGRDSEDNQ